MYEAPLHQYFAKVEILDGIVQNYISYTVRNKTLCVVLLLSFVLFLTWNRHTSPQFPRMLPFQQKFFLILKFCGNSHKAFVINCRNILINGYGLYALEIFMLDHQLSIFMTLPGLDIQFQPQTEEI